MRFAAPRLRLLRVVLIGMLPCVALAEPVEFNLPAQDADDALFAFSRQAQTEVLFSFDDLHRARSAEVIGRHEPEVAITRLLAGTGFAARRNGNGRFVVTPAAQPTGSIKGRLNGAEGEALPGVRVHLPDTRQSEVTDAHGEFDFASVPPGRHRLVAVAAGYQPMQLDEVPVTANRVLTLAPQILRPLGEPSRLAPFFVAGQADEARPFARRRDSLPPRTAVGNVDLPRTENGALPYEIHDGDRIRRSGVVDLNEYLQRELLDSDVARRPPEQDAGAASYVIGSTNLSLRGYNQAGETVVLVNGRRLPEILTSGGSPTLQPDVNFIPLSLVGQIEVLPVSASALYNGNPIGGVINILLRPEADASATEISTTYTNAVAGYDAPQSSFSFLHGQSLLGGALRVRLNASITRTEPPTEGELRYRQRRAAQLPGPFPWESVFRATPNIRTPNLDPLFGPGTSSVTSVAPGARGTGGLAAFADREGLRSLEFFDAPGGLATSHHSTDQPYGRRQQRTAYYASAVYDVSPRLQVGLDATWAGTVINRGHEVFSADLWLTADAPRNPFGQDVIVSLNDTAPQLGEGYTEARVELLSTVLGLLARLPHDWRLSVDAQYARSITKYRGLAGADGNRWQELVDAGLYNPLRDTAAFSPPREFYEQVLVYRGRRGKYVTLGDYDTLDVAFRATHESLPLPTGRGVLNFGADYRRNHLADYHEQLSYGDGSPASDPTDWSGRILHRYSAFTELQAPLVPQHRLPWWLHATEADLAVRYIAANNAREAYVSPTLGLRFGLPAGLSVRGSFTTANRYPSPQMSRVVLAPATGPGGDGGAEYFPITDPVRHESYEVPAIEDLNPNLFAEAAVTQTVGVMFQRGRVHRLRASLDYVDTRKSNELVALTPQAVIGYESLLPERVFRDPPAEGDPHAVGRISSVIAGTLNLAWRHSQNWNAAFDYAWTECAGGRLELYGRMIYYERYKRRLFPSSPAVDELRHPEASDFTLLRYRVNFGAGWSTRDFGFGFDGRYLHSRVLPVYEWTAQGHDRIRPHWQFDTFVQGNLGRWLPWQSSRYDLRARLRVNNVLDAPFPKYVHDPSGAAVQPYGDWRGRTYSISVTAAF